MEKIINDIEVKSIQFVNNKNDIVLSLTKYQGGDIVYEKKLFFENILAVEILFDMDQEMPLMPYLFIEINIKQVNLYETNKLPRFAQKRRNWGNYKNAFTVFCSGDVELNLICKKVIETHDTVKQENLL